MAAAIDWPTDTVPFCNITNFTPSRVENFIEEKPREGGGQKRVTATRSLWILSDLVVPALTKTQMLAFWTWWENTLNFGSENFNLENPVTGDTDEWMITGLPQTPRTGPAKWDLVITLEQR